MNDKQCYYCVECGCDDEYAPDELIRVNLNEDETVQCCQWCYDALVDAQDEDDYYACHSVAKLNKIC